MDFSECCAGLGPPLFATAQIAQRPRGRGRSSDISPGTGLLVSDGTQFTHYRHKWPIASHFHSGGFEFSYLGEDLDEPVGEPEQTLAGVGVCERTAEHLHEMLGGEQDVDDPVKACAC